MTGINDDTYDYYELLGVAADSDVVVLRTAFLAQAKLWHPDVQVNATEAERAAAAARFRAVREAWACLSDERRRAAYDRSRPVPASSRPTPRPSRPPGPSLAERKPSTWLARASLSAVVSRLDSTEVADYAVTSASAAVYRISRHHLADDEAATTVAEAQRRAYTAAARAGAAWAGPSGESNTLADTPNLQALVGDCLWVMEHELWAELDPDAREGLFEPSTTVNGSRDAGSCSVCGRRPSGRFGFRTIRGRGLLYRSTAVSGDFCRDCGRSIGRDAQHVTLNVGWWGIVAVFATTLALWTNAKSLRRVGELPEPTGEPALRRAPLDPGRAVSSRGLTGLVLFVATLALLVGVIQFVG